MKSLLTIAFVLLTQNVFASTCTKFFRSRAVSEELTFTILNGKKYAHFDVKLCDSISVRCTHSSAVYLYESSNRFIKINGNGPEILTWETKTHRYPPRANCEMASCDRQISSGVLKNEDGDILCSTTW